MYLLKKVFIHALVFVLLTNLLILSCDDSGDNTNPGDEKTERTIKGVWKDNSYISMSTITITDTHITYDIDISLWESGVGGTAQFFEGEILEIVNDGAAGYIVFQYTECYYLLSLFGVEPGTYTVLAWKNYDDDTVSFAFGGIDWEEFFLMPGEQSKEDAIAAFIDAEYEFSYQDFIR